MRRVLTLETLREIALTCKSRGEFYKKDPSAYYAAKRMGVYESICGHMKERSHNWSHDELRQEFLKYETVGDVRRGNKRAYDIAVKRGCLREFCGHMKDDRYHYWPDEELHRIARSCETKEEFRTKHHNAWHAALKRGLLENFCSHMVETNHYWPHEELKRLALGCGSKEEFRTKYYNAWHIAQRRGVLDDLCGHMPKSQNVSTAEQELGEILKAIYPKTQPLKIRKKNLVPGHPWIYGMDIDHYIPELRKGIEFDGKFWHSLEGLKKGRPNWPDTDLPNYHQIKDRYFLEHHNIQILHIKETDWIKDKEACIKRCLDFLAEQS